MKLTPDNTTLIGDALDHPECVCLSDDATMYAGGEAGQIYRIASDGTTKTIAETGGFVLGTALDGNGSLYVCDIKHRAIISIDPGGKVSIISSGTVDRPMSVPNYAAFDAMGNLYVSDSGDYWSHPGTGCIYVIRPGGRTEVFHPGPLDFANGLAVDAESRWLYVVLSTDASVAKLPLDRPGASPQAIHRLPSGVVPDGIVLLDDGRFLICCYKPDALYVGEPNGGVSLLFDDPTGELLNRPTNAAFHGNRLIIANFGGWHLTAVDTDLYGLTPHRPEL